MSLHSLFEEGSDLFVGRGRLLLDEGKLTGEGEDLHLVPFCGGECGFGMIEREEPFVVEELEPKTGGEERGIEGEFFEIGADESKGGFLIGELGAQEILHDGACCGKRGIILTKFKEGVEQSSVSERMNFFVRFEIDPLSQTKGSERAFFRKKGEKPLLRCKNL